MKPILMSAMLVTTAFAAWALPTAAAHECYAENPAADCGPCPWGTHDHRYNDSTPYCESHDPGIICHPLIQCIP